MYLSAGFICSAFDSTIKKDENLRCLTKKLCNFEAIGDLVRNPNVSIDEKSNLLAVLNNIIIRGFPTYSSYFIEEHFAKYQKYNLKVTNDGKVIGTLEDVNQQSYFDQLFAEYAPSSKLREYQTQKSGSTFEHGLIEALEQKFGTWINLILNQQVSFDTLAPGRNLFPGQEVDFVLSFPIEINSIKGVIIEMDGDPYHSEYDQVYLDFLRDNKSFQLGYHSIRIKSSDSPVEVEKKLSFLDTYLDHPIFELFKSKAFEKDKKENFLFLPMTCAKVQLCIIRALINKDDWRDNNEIKIAIIERDIDGLQLAVQDLNHWLSHFSVLVGEFTIPQIDYKVFKQEREIDDFNEYDLIVDVSALSRDCDIQRSYYPNAIVIRRAPFFVEADRLILTGPHINYKSLGSFENTEWRSTNPEAELSLTYMLKSFYRKSSFRTGQIPILDRALRGLSVIGLLPTGGGKSLTYQIAALMQPGVCMVIDPIISLMLDQVTGLERHWIDACEFLNSTIKSQQKKAEIQSRIKNGKTLFFFISPERLLIEDFRNYLNAMSSGNNQIFFNYCVIDEAHCVSEWGHDFRTSYLSVAENAIRFCKHASPDLPTIPLFALTATASYDVLTDIQRELSGNDMNFRIGEEAIVEPESHKREELTFEIVPIDDSSLLHAKGFELKEKISKLKKQEIAEIINEKRDLLNDNSGLIFCPHRSHFYGITDQFKAENTGYGVLDNLYRRFPDIKEKMGFFMGASDLNDNVQKYSIQNQNDFIEGKKNLLVATKAFGMGIDKSNIRFTIHFNYPGSIESFLQEAGRAGRDKEKATCYLLYTTSDLLEDTELEVNTYFHSKAYRGAEKEKAVINEILFEIHEPDRTYGFTADLNDRFDIPVTVSAWTVGDGKFLSVHDGNRLGKIKINPHPGGNEVFPDDPFSTDSHTYDLILINKVLNYLNDKIRTKRTKRTPAQIWKWINTTGETRDGLLVKILSGECSSERYSNVLTIAWENNISERIGDITKYVKIVLKRNKQINKDNYIASTVKAAVLDSLSFEDMLDEIDRRFTKTNFSLDLRSEMVSDDRKKGQKKGTRFSNLNLYYNQVRDKADTEKAIYRLRLLGVLDDYTVDYRTNTFKLYFSKKSDQFFRERLSHYLSKFYSSERVDIEMMVADQKPGKHIIQKYLNYLVDFGYDQIARKRKRAISEMKEACLYGLSKPDDLAEYLNLYLNSKYAREVYEVDGVNESLVFRLNNGAISNMSEFDHYIELMKRDGNSELNNMKHLRGATSRMLAATPDNPVLLSLRAFATFFLEYDNEKLLEASENDLSLAFDLLEDKQGWGEEELKSWFESFTDIILQKRPKILEHYIFEFENFRFQAFLNTLKLSNETLDILETKLT